MSVGINIIISGKVQGVFFRANTQKIAVKLNIAGWVRNLPNGDVEVVAFGEAGNIQEFISWLKHGPELAVVDNIKIIDIDFNNEFTSFNIK